MEQEYENAAERFKDLGVIPLDLHTVQPVDKDTVVIRDVASGNNHTLVEDEVRQVEELENWKILKNNKRLCFLEYAGDMDSVDVDSTCPVCNQECVAYHEIRDDDAESFNIRSDFVTCERNTHITESEFITEVWVHQ